MANREDYRLLIERQWADIHHSRIQEWTALGVVAGAHLGLIQLAKLAIDAQSAISGGMILKIAGIIGAVLSVLGALMTCRHRHLMQVKFGWIYLAELKLGLVNNKDNLSGIIPENAQMLTPLAWRRLALPRFLSTSGLIFSIYVVFIVLDIAAVVWLFVWL